MREWDLLASNLNLPIFTSGLLRTDTSTRSTSGAQTISGQHPSNQAWLAFARLCGVLSMCRSIPGIVLEAWAGAGVR